MNAFDSRIEFPVVGFTPDYYMWAFKNIEELTTCGTLTLRDNMQNGLILIGSDCRSWRVRSIRRIKRTGSWLMVLLTAKTSWLIEHDLETLPNTSIDDLRERALKSVETYESDYKGFPGEDDFYASVLNDIRNAQSVSDVIRATGCGGFDTY